MISLRPVSPVSEWVTIEKIAREVIQADAAFPGGPILLAWALTNQTRGQEGQVYRERALRLADNATPQERYFILASLHGANARGPGDGRRAIIAQPRELEKAAAAMEALFALQPDHYAVKNNLRNVYRLLGRDRDLAWMNLRLADARPWSVDVNLEVANQLLREGNADGARRYGARAESALSPGSAAADPNLAAGVRLFRAYVAWLQVIRRKHFERSIGSQRRPRSSRIPSAVSCTCASGLYTRRWDGCRRPSGRSRQCGPLTATISRTRSSPTWRARISSRTAVTRLAFVSWRRTRGAILCRTRHGQCSRRACRSSLKPDWSRGEARPAMVQAADRPETSAWGAARAGAAIGTVLREQCRRDRTGAWPACRGGGGLREVMPALRDAPPPILSAGGSQGQYAALTLAAALEAIGNVAEAIGTLEQAVADRVGVTIGNTPNRWVRANAQLERLYRRKGEEAKARASKCAC